MLFLDWRAVLYSHTHAHTHYFSNLSLAYTHQDCGRMEMLGRSYWAQSPSFSICATTSTCTKAGSLLNLDRVLFLWLEYHFSSNSSTHMDPQVPRDNLGLSLCFHLFNASWKPVENGKAFKSLSLLIRKLHETTSILCACNPAKHGRVRSCTCINLANSIKINGAVPVYTNKKRGPHDCTLCLAHLPHRLPVEFSRKLLGLLFLT